jgi:hypothetical protein
MAKLLRRLRAAARAPARRARAASEARIKIVELFENSIQDVGGHRGWGQDLDSQVSQYGIYGTSAGVQVIVTKDGENSGVVQDALNLLRTIEDPESLFRKKRDHLNTYKLIYCADATAPLQTSVASPSPPMDRLMTGALPGGLWGDYVAGDGLPVPLASELATALAVYALRRYDGFHGPDCTAALKWLAETGSEHAWSAADLKTPTRYAITLLALEAYAGTDAAKAVDGFEDKVRCFRRALTRWSRRRPRAYLCEQYRHDFVESGPYKAQSDFMAFMPDCIAAFAFLEAPQHLNSRRRRHARRVIDKVSSEVLRARFHPRNVGTRSSLDHLWAHRLLALFVPATVQAAMRGLRGRLIFGPIWIVGPVWVAMLLAATVLWRLSFDVDGIEEAIVLVAATVLVALVPTLFAIRMADDR